METQQQQRLITIRINPVPLTYIRVGRKTPRSGRKEMTNLGQEEIANSPVSEFLI